MAKAMDITRFFAIEKRERRLTYLVQSPPKTGTSLSHAIAKVKKLDLGGYQEITINPKMEYIQALDDNDIRDKVEKDIRKKLETTKQYMMKKFDKHEDMIRWDPQFIFIGEHGTEGQCKLHYHGIVKGIPNDMMSHFIKLVRTTIGRTELKYIRNDERYKNYMFKSYDNFDNRFPETWGKHSIIEINILEEI